MTQQLSPAPYRAVKKDHGVLAAIRAVQADIGSQEPVRVVRRKGFYAGKKRKRVFTASISDVWIHVGDHSALPVRAVSMSKNGALQQCLNILHKPELAIPAYYGKAVSQHVSGPVRSMIGKFSEARSFEFVQRQAPAGAS